MELEWKDLFMDSVDTILHGVVPSMEAMAVSIANCMVYGEMKFCRHAVLSVFWESFQPLMPYSEFKIGNFFCGFVTKYSGAVIFLIPSIVVCFHASVHT